MMTLKDKGNEEFKKNNLQKAIEYYCQYVESDNKDNQLAFTNIAMCYFKLKNYTKTIQACQKALEEKKQFPKAYYRLYLTYKEIPDQQYQVFINAYFFLKYFTEENQNAKAEALSIMRQYKNKFINKNKIEKINAFDEGILNDFASLDFDVNSQIIEQPSSIFEWEEYLQNTKIDIRQRWQKIQLIGVKQYDFAINLAYLLLNRCSNQQDKFFVKQQISQMKKKKVHIQTAQQKIEKIEAQQEHKMSFQESDENLFQSESEKVEANKQIRAQQTNDEQSKQRSQTPLKLDDKKIVQQKVNKGEQVAFEFERNEYVSSPEQINNQIDVFVKGTQKSRDIFKDIHEFVIKLLKSSRTIQSKKKYLLQLHKKCNQTKYIKISLSLKDQKQIYTLLVMNSLQELYEIYAPKAK